MICDSWWISRSGCYFVPRILYNWWEMWNNRLGNAAEYKEKPREANLGSNETTLLHSPFYCLFQWKVFLPFQWLSMFVLTWTFFIQENHMNMLTFVCLKKFEVLSSKSNFSERTCLMLKLVLSLETLVKCLPFWSTPLQLFLFISLRSPASVLLNSYTRFLCASITNFRPFITSVFLYWHQSVSLVQLDHLLSRFWSVLGRNS